MMYKNEITEKKMVEVKAKETAASNKEGGPQALPIFRFILLFLQYGLMEPRLTLNSLCSGI